MSIWAEIKSTVNSTLGTKNFKPLDKMVEMRMFPSDNVLCEFGMNGKISGVDSSTFTIPTDQNTPWTREFALGLGGIFRLYIKLSPATNINWGLNIYKNGKLDGKFEIGGQDTTITTSANKDDIIKVEIYSKSSIALRMQSFQIQASIAPGGSIESLDGIPI